MADVTPNVVVGYCSPDNILSPLFHQAIVRLLFDDREHESVILDVISLLSSPRIASSRNQIVARALLMRDKGAEWLLMLDTDMVFQPSLIRDLMDAVDPVERPIVSGLYFGGRLGGKQIPHCYLLNDAGTAFNPIEGVNGLGEWGPVAKVHAVGAGCLLMHLDTLERVGAQFLDTGFPWFVEGQGAGKDIGEDMAFCFRLLSMQIPLHCHTGVILGHVKPGVIDETTYREYLADRDVIGDDGVQAKLNEQLRIGGHVAEVKVTSA